MTASYSRRGPGQQGIPAAAEFLLASFGQTESAESARFSRMLRDQALRFAAVRDEELSAVVRDALDSLAADCDAEGATLALWRREASPQLLASSSAGEDPVLRRLPSSDVEKAMRNAPATPFAIEFQPDGTSARPLASLVLPDREGDPRFRRWVLCDAPATGGVVILSVWSAVRTRGWTPFARRLHDGTAEVVAVVAGRIVRRRNRDDGP